MTPEQERRYREILEEEYSFRNRATNDCAYRAMHRAAQEAREEEQFQAKVDVEENMRDARRAALEEAARIADREGLSCAAPGDFDAGREIASENVAQAIRQLAEGTDPLDKPAYVSSAAGFGKWKHGEDPLDQPVTFRDLIWCHKGQWRNSEDDEYVASIRHIAKEKADG